MSLCTACEQNEAVPVLQNSGPTVSHLCQSCYSKYAEPAKKPTCEACGKNESIGPCCVPGTPYSAAYCRECLYVDCHPWSILVANTSLSGKIDNCADWWQEMVMNTLKHTGRTLGEFNAAVAEFSDKDEEHAEVGIPHYAVQELKIGEFWFSPSTRLYSSIDRNGDEFTLTEAHYEQMGLLKTELSASIEAVVKKFEGRPIEESYGELHTAITGFLLSKCPQAYSVSCSVENNSVPDAEKGILNVDISYSVLRKLIPNSELPIDPYAE